MDHPDQAKRGASPREELRGAEPRRVAGLTGAGLGMACMLLATACFAAMNGLIRYLGKDGLVPPAEIAFFRAFLGLMILLPFLAWFGVGAIRTQRLRMHMLRGGVQGVSMTLFFIGLSLVPLAKVTAFEFAAPILATVLAIVFLGEAVRVRRLVALAVGFVGIMLVLRPGVIPLSLGPLLVIASVILWASCQLMIRSLSRTETSFAQTFYMTLWLSPVTGLLALPVWQWPSWHALGVMTAIAAIANIGTVLYGEAFRRAEMSAVLPLESTKIIWTALIGWVAFAETPDVWTLVGGMTIFAAAAYITIREAQLSRNAKTTASASAVGPE